MNVIKSHLVTEDEGNQMLETFLYYVAVLMELTGFGLKYFD